MTIRELIEQRKNVYKEGMYKIQNYMYKITEIKLNLN